MTDSLHLPTIGVLISDDFFVGQGVLYEDSKRVPTSSRTSSRTITDTTQLTDIVDRYFTRDSIVETKQVSFLPVVRVMQRIIDENVLFEDEDERDASRTISEQKELQDIVSRHLSKPVPDAKSLKGSLFRKLTRLVADAKLLSSVELRLLQRIIEDSKQLDDIVDRALTRIIDEDVVLTSLKETRILTRSASTEITLLSIIVDRYFERAMEDTKLFEDEDERDVTRIITETKQLLVSKIEREMTRISTEDKTLTSSAAKYVSRVLETEDKLVTVFTTGQLSRLNFEGYISDKNALLETSYDWLERAYSHDILQIIHRAFQETKTTGTP